MCWKKKLAPTTNQFSESFTNFTWKETTSHSWLSNSSWRCRFQMRHQSFGQKQNLFFFSSSLSVNVAVHGIPNTRRQLPSLQKWSTFKRFEASNARYQTTHFRGIRRITWYKYTAPFPDVFSLLGLLGHTKQTPKIAKNRSNIHFCPSQPKKGIGTLGSTTTATK